MTGGESDGPSPDLTAFYREAFAASPDGILLVDGATQRAIAFNDATCRQLGYTREEFAALRIADYEASEDQSVIEHRIRAAAADGVAEFDTVHRTKAGELRNVHVWAKALRVAGRPAFYAKFRDVTARWRADEAARLRLAALHAAADAIVITDRRGSIEWVNPAFTQLTGYALEEAMGRSPGDLVRSGRHGPEFYREMWETITAGRTWQGALVNRRKDGTLYHEEQTITPILDAAGAVTHFVAIKKDVTARLKLEGELRQAQKMDTVGQLASGVAHDFNNLLTVINGMSELLLGGLPDGDPMRDDVQEILRAGARAAELTHQLLAFSRQQMLQPEVIDLNAVVGAAGNLLRRLLGEDIRLVVEAASDLRPVKADPGQIEQVIVNLAVNARDAMPEGGHLTLRTRNHRLDEPYTGQGGVTVPAGDYVQLEVADSGVGMDEATRQRAFEPFFTTKPRGKGTGLGLSTVYGIVKQSQGFIWLYSEPGKGSSFRILLPRVPDGTEAARPRPAAAPTSGSETILLVEDNAGLHKLVARQLQSAGYTVVGARDGREALRLLEQRAQPIHLLLTDVVMPQMGGRQLVEQLGAVAPGVKVLYMSGYSDDTIVRHGLLDSGVPFLNKPFTRAGLLRKIRETLDR